MMGKDRIRRRAVIEDFLFVEVVVVTASIIIQRTGTNRTRAQGQSKGCQGTWIPTHAVTE